MTLTRSFGAATAIALALSALTAAQAQAQARDRGNAVQRREDRVNPDRWNRAERSVSDADAFEDLEPAEEDAEARDESEVDDDEDSDDDQDAAARRRTRKPVDPRHRGELNGKLRLGEW